MVALHGRIAEVVCLDLPGGDGPERAAASGSTELNPGFAERHLAAEVRPDGDVELDETDDFVVAGCVGCGGRAQAGRGLLRRERAGRPGRALLRRGRRARPTGGALLVAGSSLTVMSGFRFVRRAAKAGTPVVIVNRGRDPRRRAGDVPLDAGAAEFLTALAGAAQTG